jgi:periplasmic divalent cation tolerance protein
MKTDRRIVLTTTGSRAEAERIARKLVEARQAACVNIVGPIQSVYRWKAAVETASEWLLLVKTTAQAAGAVQDSIRRLHSYELPECVEIAVEGGSAEYLAWIGAEVGSKADSEDAS